MNNRKETAFTRFGQFQLNDVASPVLPVFSATTFVTPSINRLSTISSESLIHNQSSVMSGLYYGGVDTPTTLAFSRCIAELEGGNNAVIATSGQAAIFLTLSTLLKSGDHLLVSTTVIYTTKWLVERHFKKNGIQISYFRPEEAYTIDELLNEQTKAVLWESPGAFFYDIVDPRPIVLACKDRGVITIVDNTWSASAFFNPFDHNIDISVLSLSKSHAGATGASLGAVVTSDVELHKSLKIHSALLGTHIDGASCSAVAQSVTTLGARLDRQQESTRIVLSHLSQFSSTLKVFHPEASSECKVSVYRELYCGFNSLLSIKLSAEPQCVARWLDKMAVFRPGYGWGGSISLINVFHPAEFCDQYVTEDHETYLRLYVGLESTAGMLNDLSGIASLGGK